MINQALRRFDSFSAGVGERAHALYDRVVPLTVQSQEVFGQHLGEDPKQITLTATCQMDSQPIQAREGKFTVGHIVPGFAVGTDYSGFDAKSNRKVEFFEQDDFHAITTGDNQTSAFNLLKTRSVVTTILRGQKLQQKYPNAQITVFAADRQVDPDEAKNILQAARKKRIEPYHEKRIESSEK